MDAAAVTGARNWEAVRERHPAIVERLEAGLTQGDPLADAVIVEARERGISFSTLVALLEEHTSAKEETDVEQLEMPASMTHLLQVASTPPPWFDPAWAEAGARAWWRFGTLQSSTLYQSLIYGFKAQGFVRPLVATGRLGSGTRDRVESTARWVAEATTPGSMLPGRPGWAATLRIRLLHAYIRDVLRHPPGGDPTDDAGAWDEGEWGAPINQTYAVMTISCGFLALPLVVARDFGIHYSSAECEAITHLWRWIGWVIGVDDDLLPPSYESSSELFRIAGEFELQPDDSSKVLIKALLREGYDLPRVVHGAAGGHAIHATTTGCAQTAAMASSARPPIFLKRAYEEPAPGDGQRLLVDHGVHQTLTVAGGGYELRRRQDTRHHREPGERMGVEQDPAPLPRVDAGLQEPGRDPERRRSRPAERAGVGAEAGVDAS